MSESCESRIYCNRPGPNHDYHLHLEYFDSQKVRSFRTTLTSNRIFFHFTGLFFPGDLNWVIQELENTQGFRPIPFREHERSQENFTRCVVLFVKQKSSFHNMKDVFNQITYRFLTSNLTPRLKPSIAEETRTSPEPQVMSPIGQAAMWIYLLKKDGFQCGKSYVNDIQASVAFQFFSGLIQD